MNDANAPIETQLVHAVAYMGRVEPRKRFFTVEAPLPGQPDEHLQDLTLTLGAELANAGSSFSQAPPLDGVSDTRASIFDTADLVLHVFLNGQSVYSRSVHLGEAVHFSESFYKMLRRAHWAFVLCGRWANPPTPNSAASAANSYALFAHMDYFASKQSTDVRRVLAVPRVRLTFGELSYTYDQNTGCLHDADRFPQISSYSSCAVSAQVPHQANCVGEHSHSVGVGAIGYVESDGSVVLDLGDAYPSDDADTTVQQVRLVFANSCANGGVNGVAKLDALPLLASTRVEPTFSAPSMFSGKKSTHLGYAIVSSASQRGVSFVARFSSLERFLEACAQYATGQNGELLTVYATCVRRPVE